MSSLKEKAKTEDWLRAFGAIGSDVLWVKLEDAQKEIDFQKARVNVADEMVSSKQKRIDELKQKLQRWFEDLGRWIFSQRKDWSHPELPEDLKERFMELLKEEKEAKTT